jgi:hypothetical protein
MVRVATSTPLTRMDVNPSLERQAIDRWFQSPTLPVASASNAEKLNTPPTAMSRPFTSRIVSSLSENWPL